VFLLLLLSKYKNEIYFGLTTIREKKRSTSNIWAATTVVCEVSRQCALTRLLRAIDRRDFALLLFFYSWDKQYPNTYIKHRETLIIGRREKKRKIKRKGRPLSLIWWHRSAIAKDCIINRDAMILQIERSHRTAVTRFFNWFLLQ
jgi:hypothetical protein